MCLHSRHSGFVAHFSLFMYVCTYIQVFIYIHTSSYWLGGSSKHPSSHIKATWVIAFENFEFWLPACATGLRKNFISDTRLWNSLTASISWCHTFYHLPGSPLRIRNALCRRPFARVCVCIGVGHISLAQHTAHLTFCRYFKRSV